jgi:hypothetical protein
VPRRDGGDSGRPCGVGARQRNERRGGRSECERSRSSASRRPDASTGVRVAVAREGRSAAPAVACREACCLYPVVGHGAHVARRARPRGLAAVYAVNCADVLHADEIRDAVARVVVTLGVVRLLAEGPLSSKDARRDARFSEPLVPKALCPNLTACESAWTSSVGGARAQASESGMHGVIGRARVDGVWVDACRRGAHPLDARTAIAIVVDRVERAEVVVRKPPKNTTTRRYAAARLAQVPSGAGAVAGAGADVPVGRTRCGDRQEEHCGEREACKRRGRLPARHDAWTSRSLRGPADSEGDPYTFRPATDLAP